MAGDVGSTSPPALFYSPFYHFCLSAKHLKQGLFFVFFSSACTYQSLGTISSNGLKPDMKYCLKSQHQIPKSSVNVHDQSLNIHGNMKYCNIELLHACNKALHHANRSVCNYKRPCPSTSLRHRASPEWLSTLHPRPHHTSQ
jgi:hypothetical protein